MMKYTTCVAKCRSIDFQKKDLHCNCRVKFAKTSFCAFSQQISAYPPGWGNGLKKYILDCQNFSKILNFTNFLNI